MSLQGGRDAFLPMDLIRLDNLSGDTEQKEMMDSDIFPQNLTQEEILKVILDKGSNLKRAHSTLSGNSSSKDMNDNIKFFELAYKCSLKKIQNEEKVRLYLYTRKAT